MFWNRRIWLLHRAHESRCPISCALHPNASQYNLAQLFNPAYRIPALFSLSFSNLTARIFLLVLLRFAVVASSFCFPIHDCTILSIAVLHSLFRQIQEQSRNWPRQRSISWLEVASSGDRAQSESEAHLLSDIITFSSSAQRPSESRIQSKKEWPDSGEAVSAQQ